MRCAPIWGGSSTSTRLRCATLRATYTTILPVALPDCGIATDFARTYCAQFEPHSMFLNSIFHHPHHSSFEGLPHYPYSLDHIPILTPRYSQGLSFGLNLSSVIDSSVSPQTPPNTHGPGLVKVAPAESSPVGVLISPTVTEPSQWLLSEYKQWLE